MSKDNEPINDFDEDEGAMPWELHAPEAVERVVEYVELNETRGVVYVLSGEDHRFNTYRERFFSAYDLRDRLEEIAGNESASYAPVDEEPGFGLSQVDRSGTVALRQEQERVMGHIYQRVRLRGEKTATVRMLVDTVATFSVISPRLARRLGIKRPRRSVSVRLADGRRIRLGADLALVQIDGREAPTTVLVGNVDEPILGVEALEALGLIVDPHKKRLSPSRPYAVRLGGYR